MKRPVSRKNSVSGAPGTAAETKKGVSRRQMFQRAAVAASALPLAGQLAAQAPQAPPAGAAAPAAAPGRGGPRVTQGGTGPIKALVITKYHAYEREPFNMMFDSFGRDITWTHVEHPAAQAFFSPEMAKPYDLFILYDAFAGRVRRTNADGTVEQVETEPSGELRKNFKALLQQGKGFVFFHHALASWVHTWPEYVEVMGGAADWGKAMKIRGKDYVRSGFRGNTQQHVTVVDKTHPITQGLGDGFDIVDETYLCPMFEDSVHPLLRTNFEPKVANFPQQSQDPKWIHPDGSNMTAWVKTAENSPIAYIQHGHNAVAWDNPAFRTLMLNAIKWASSKEALDWAKKNPKKIFS